MTQSDTKWFQEAFARGDLIALGQSNPLGGVSLFATRTLWRGLLWPYPSSTPRDHLQLNQIEHALAKLLSSHHGSVCQAVFSPQRYSKWLHPNFVVKSELHHVDDKLSRVVLLHSDEYLSWPVANMENVLPLGLLISLFRNLKSMQLVARTADKVPLKRLLKLAKIYAASHPMWRHVDNTVIDSYPTMPAELSPAEFHNLLLATLSKSLDVISALDFTLRSTLLRLHFNEIRFIANELLDIIEITLLFTAKATSRANPSFDFRRLLAAYRKVYRLVQSRRRPPPFLLNQLDIQLHRLSIRLPCFSPELNLLRRRLKSLSCMDNFNADLTNAYDHKLVWH